MEGHTIGNDGGIDMRRLDDNEIQEAAEKLAGLIRYNDEVLKPEKRIVHTAACVVKDGMMLAVNGPAHMLKPLFCELLRRRPDLRQVMDRALEEYGF